MGSVGELRADQALCWESRLATGLQVRGALGPAPPSRAGGWGEAGWPGGAGGLQERTFAVHARAPGPAGHGHLVLVAAGVTALPAEPRGARAAARVQVTGAPLALAAWGGGEDGVSGRPSAPGHSPPRGAHGSLTPAALLGTPPVARGTLAALEPGGPRPAVALPTLGVALGALSSWSTGTRLAAAAALEAEVSVLWHG